MDGLLVIDKPAGPTSHDVVARVRRLLGERRIGHTGTLDPTATGVLPLVLGRATRLARFLSAGDKTYEADVRLGTATDTYDAAGAAVGTPHTGAWPSPDEISRALDAFRGEFLQQPPAFSAKKIAGRRSYALARHVSSIAQRFDPGRAPASIPAPVRVATRAIDVLAIDGDRVSLRIHCSAGFYVRSLAHDLGQRLGIGAHLAALRRVRSGDVTAADALPLDTAERDPNAARAAVIPLDRMLPGLRAVVLTEAEARRACHGCDLAAPDAPVSSASADTAVRLLDPEGHLLGIAEPSGTPGLLHPSVVLM